MLWQVKFEEIDFYTHLMTGSVRVSNFQRVYLNTLLRILAVQFEHGHRIFSEIAFAQVDLSGRCPP